MISSSRVSSDINQSITIEINTFKASGPEDFLNTITNMLWYTVPFVLLVAGTFGNVMTVVVMRGLRASQSTACLSVYFTALAVSDQCLLTSILWFWIDVVFTSPPSFYRFNLLCTVLYFAFYTSTQTSTWFLVAMTYQRVTSVVAPHRVGVLCTVRRGKIITATIGIVACGLNLHFLFTIVYSREYGGCASGEKYAPFIDVFTMVDLFIASVIPFLLLLFGNSVLIIQVERSMKLSWRLRGNVVTDKTSGAIQKYPMTKTLILTSTVFLVLTLPICILDTYKRTLDTQSADDYFNAVLNLVNAVTQLMWLAASASNFYLYLLSGNKFREEAKRCLGYKIIVTREK
ncbi:hypothetical protein ACOMHN_024202 [Nucella lapillus]